MTGRSVALQMQDVWERANRQATAHKKSQLAVFMLEDFYVSLPVEHRPEANEVLIAWALGDDLTKRFDALALIDRFEIGAAIPALRALADRFEQADGPSAPYDWAKVNRILASLTEQHSAPDDAGESGE